MLLAKKTGLIANKSRQKKIAGSKTSFEDLLYIISIWQIGI